PRGRPRQLRTAPRGCPRQLRTAPRGRPRQLRTAPRGCPRQLRTVVSSRTGQLRTAPRGGLQRVRVSVTLLGRTSGLEPSACSGSAPRSYGRRCGVSGRAGSGISTCTCRRSATTPTRRVKLRVAGRPCSSRTEKTTSASASGPW
ncbi:hypothetical protein T484DRAFT_1644985, partial [Baffinella frigidus]